MLVRIVLVTGLCLGMVGCNNKAPGNTSKTSTSKATAVPSYAGTIVAVGDSLTAGRGVAEDQAYPARLARRLRSDGYNYRVVNAGVSGETSSGALSRIQWVISSLAPDIVILETGANDGLRGLDPALLESNLDNLVGRLQAAHIQVVLAGMRMLPNLGADYTRAFSATFPRIAEKYGVIFMPFFLEGVAGKDRLNQPDKLHPTGEGYARIVENLYPYVIKAIRQREGKGPAPLQ